MNETRPLFAYAFAYVGRRLQSMDELNANAALRRQRYVQLKFEKASGRPIQEHVPDWSTYRSPPFVLREKFRRTVDLARGVGADLLLANIRELMARTKRDRISECADALDALDVEVWDASAGRTWQSMTDDERRSLVIHAAQESKSRSETVKAGIRLSGTKKAAPPNANYRRGNQANRHKANERASRLRNFVLTEIAKLPEGEELSPSALAEALNSAGIPSARGGSWSHNTAKDLIARVRNLPASSPET